VEQALGHELPDVTARHEGRVQLDHRGGPEPLGLILAVHMSPDVGGPNGYEGPRETLVLGDQPVAECENIHGYEDRRFRLSTICGRNIAGFYRLKR
jgi:hypothetical protein